MTSFSKYWTLIQKHTYLWAGLIFVSGLCLHLWLIQNNHEGYLASLTNALESTTLFLRSIPDLGGQMAEGVWKYLGIFFIPIGWGIVAAFYAWLKFEFARFKQSPVSPAECFDKWQQLSYVSITRASQWGMLGTLGYIIVGLGLMAAAMMTVAENLQSQKPMMDVLPGIFLIMAQSVMKIVPALGTTVGAQIAEMLAVRVKKIIEDWYGSGCLDLQYEPVSAPQERSS